jgi:hypothetical protein
MRVRVLALVMLLTGSGAAHAQWTTCLQAGVPSMNTLLTGAVYKVIAPWGAVAREDWWGTPVCAFPYNADVYIENYRCNWRQCSLWVNGLDRPVWLPRNALSYGECPKRCVSRFL